MSRRLSLPVFAVFAAFALRTAPVAASGTGGAAPQDPQAWQGAQYETLLAGAVAKRLRGDDPAMDACLSTHLACHDGCQEKALAADRDRCEAECDDTLGVCLGQ